MEGEIHGGGGHRLVVVVSVFDKKFVAMAGCSGAAATCKSFGLL